MTGRTTCPTTGTCPDLLQQLTLAVLDHAADDGLRMIKMIRAYLDTWESFLQHRQELVDHLRAAHNAASACTMADPASLNRQHWQADGSDPASVLGAHPIQV